MSVKSEACYDCPQPQSVLVIICILVQKRPQSWHSGLPHKQGWENAVYLIRCWKCVNRDFLEDLFNFFHVWVFCPHAMYMHHVCAWHLRGRRGHQIHCNWSYGQLWVVTSVLGPKQEQQAESSLQPRWTGTICARTMCSGWGTYHCTKFFTLMPFIICFLTINIENCLWVNRWFLKTTYIQNRYFWGIKVFFFLILDNIYTTRIWNKIQRVNACISETRTWGHHCLPEVTGNFESWACSKM